MAKPGVLIILWALAALTLTSSSSALDTKAAISCATVTQQLAPCLSFIIDSVDKPSASCCSGAKKMADMATTKDDRQGVCECIKKTTGSLTKVNYDRIPQITKICGVKISLPPITKDTNCKSIPLMDLMGFMRSWI